MTDSERLELLTTRHCHLCEQAEALINRALPAVTIMKIDIAESDALIESYGEKIPVVRFKGQVLCWPFSLLDLRAL